MSLIKLVVADSSSSLFTNNICRCTCEDGYTGVNCTQRIDPCSKNKCKNNAKCKTSEKSYICECPPNFYGKFCESKPEKRFVLVFTRSGVTDSVRLEEFKYNLFQVHSSHGYIKNELFLF